MKTFKFLIAVHLLILFLSGLSFWVRMAQPPMGQPSKKLTPKISYQAKKKKVKPKISACEKKITQGIRGKVLFFRGNMMPSPERPVPQGQPVIRKIAFFTLTTLEQTKEGQSPGFYQTVNTKKMAEVVSDANGCFATSLPPGKYSVMVWEKGQWYANNVGGNGEIFEVEVKENALTLVDFPINYAATY